MTSLGAQAAHAAGASIIATPISVALIALGGAVAGALTSYRIAGRSVYINSITAERSKWIGTLRGNIAGYTSQLTQLSLRVHRHGVKETEAATDAVVQKLEELRYTVSLIQLQLNPWGEIDKNLIKLLQSIAVRVGTEPPLLKRASKMFIEHSQWLLKAEWEKVKYEAHGPVYRFLHRRDESRWVEKYQTWVQGAGDLSELLEAFKKDRARG